MAITDTELDIIEQTRNYKVTKSNALIQKTRFNLSLQEQKILQFIITKIEPEDDELKDYTFEIKDFCKICGIQADGMYRNLREVTQKLADKSFWFSATTNEDVLLRWISSVRYHKRQGIITIRISEDMRPFLLNLKSYFTSYSLSNILAFKSRYSLRMYELLKSYANLWAWTVSVPELKKMLDAEQYINFKDFRNRVLDTAQKEITKYTDINFTYEAVAKGRKIEKIIFKITPGQDSLKRLTDVGLAPDKK